MGLLVKDEIIRVGQVVNLAAAGVANAVVVFAIPVALLGVRSVKIYRVNLFNLAAGATQVLIGTGVGGAFAALLPALDSFNNLNDAYGPATDLIQAQAFANITAYAVALAVGTSINIQLEVIVCG
jgi:hypothetical protein